MSKKIKIAAISGSLRKNSYNSALIKAVTDLKPDNVEVDIIEIGEIPMFNDDVRQNNIPESVKKLSDKILSADGLLISTPEYNYSIPGVLKNAIDWLSKMPEQPFNEKPTAIIGATPGMLGTVRAQTHFRQIALALNLKVLNKPEIYVNNAVDKFDDIGNLTDEKTILLIKKLLSSLTDNIYNKK